MYGTVQYADVHVYLDVYEQVPPISSSRPTCTNPLFLHACFFCNVGKSIHPRHRTHHKHCMPKYHQNHRRSIRMLLYM